MNILSSLQFGVFLILSVGIFAIQLWAFIDCVRRPAASFVIAGKRTKGFWLILTGAAAAIGFIALPPLSISMFGGFFQLLAVVPSAVYLVDVRPAVRGYGGGRSTRRPGSGW